MSGNKNNIFVQLYKPLDPNTIQQNFNGVSTASPEQTAFVNQNPSEYAPIYEYVEPIIDETLAGQVQAANPVYIPQPQIPLTPTNTPPVPGIQPMTLPSIPLSDLEIEKELKTDVYTAIRWLAEWCLRQFQINKTTNDQE